MYNHNCSAEKVERQGRSIEHNKQQKPKLKPNPIPSIKPNYAQNLSPILKSRANLKPKPNPNPSPKPSPIYLTES